MKPTNPEPTQPRLSRAAPSAEHAAVALRAAAVLMAPVARWLMRNGVSYAAFADMLKAVFVDTARGELERAKAKPTFSALSMLSGVHRKDVRALETEPRDLALGSAARGVPLASQVFTRWLTAKRYRLRDGSPKPLPRTGSGASFESLARELSNDVHPRTVLDELLRLGLVRLDGDTVVAASASFTPTRRLDELTSLFAANASDHLAAAVHNLTEDGPPHLEHAVFADGLSAESIAHLRKQAATVWRSAFETMVKEATVRVEGDADIPAEAQHRMRFGVYFFSEPQALDAPPPEPARANAAKPAKLGARNRRSP